MHLSVLSEELGALRGTVEELRNPNSPISIHRDFGGKSLRKLENFQTDDKRFGSYASDLKSAERFDPYRLLKAMLDFAPTAHGKRYVAVTITFCNEI